MGINWSGKRRWIALLLLIAGFVVMFTTPPIIPVIQLPGEVYPAGWHLFGFLGPLPSITNTLAGSVIVWLLLMLLMWYVHRKRPQTGGETPPGGFYNFFEMLFEGLYNFVAGIAGSNIGKIFPVFMTIFLIVLLSNWQSLFPGVDSIGFLEPHLDRETGEPTEGYEVTNWFGNVWALNSKCPWISPEAAELLTDDERAARRVTGCYTGSTFDAAAPVAEEHAEEAEAVVEGEATIGEEGAEAAAGA
ncbi:MAG: F0F1 ATP synthase subunit A, partial [Burkholderiales bacterium]|nr:F0F1 ATP synthase subunit A [Anaerolineae bacterium]